MAYVQDCDGGVARAAATGGTCPTRQCTPQATPHPLRYMQPALAPRSAKLLAWVVHGSLHPTRRRYHPCFHSS